MNDCARGETNVSDSDCSLTALTDCKSKLTKEKEKEQQKGQNDGTKEEEKEKKKRKQLK